VWEYKTNGTLILPNQGYVTMKADEIFDLAAHPTAYHLLSYLRYYNNNKPTFAIRHSGIATKLGRNRETILKAIEVLVSKGYIKNIYHPSNTFTYTLTTY
jgi:DNA-binding MarR family transcriptional regulator